MPQENSNLRERTRSRIKEPGKYSVIFLNDDFTPMDFVVLMLVNIFFKSMEEAETLMMKVHTEGKAIVGIYSLDIAQSKAEKTIAISRANGFPLRVVVQEV